MKGFGYCWQVKNRASGRSMRLERLSLLCQRRIMLTGTPLQNDLVELYNLLRFLLPALFQNQPALEAAQVVPTPAATASHTTEDEFFSLL